MYTGLLACAYADGLSVLDEADGVGLGVFQGNQGDLHVALRVFRKIFIFRHDIGNEFIVDGKLLTALLEGHAKDLLVLQRSRLVVGVNLNDHIISFFLLLQNLQRLLCEARSDNAVGYLSLDDGSGVLVADVRQGDKVTEGGHTVRASGSCVSAGQGRQVSHIVYPVDFL